MNESWDNCQATFGYQLQTPCSHGRPTFVLTGRQMEALQQRHYRWRAMARTLRVSYYTISMCRHELGMGVGERFSCISDAELDELVSKILRRTPDAGEVMIIAAVRSRQPRSQGLSSCRPLERERERPWYGLVTCVYEN